MIELTPLPTAIIDKLNERVLDLTSELGLGTNLNSKLKP
jgi:hypothetical protein